MSGYIKECYMCGVFPRLDFGEYPCLCKMCSDYMKEQREKRNQIVKEQNKRHSFKGDYTEW